MKGIIIIDGHCEDLVARVINFDKSRRGGPRGEMILWKRRQDVTSLNMPKLGLQKNYR
jgi:hypothetical protein